MINACDCDDGLLCSRSVCCCSSSWGTKDTENFLWDIEVDDGCTQSSLRLVLLSNMPLEERRAFTKLTSMEILEFLVIWWFL